MNDKLKCRLFLVSGPAQLLFLSAALIKDAALNTKDYADVLVFSSVDYPEAKKIICKEIAETVWDWSDIVWLTDTAYFNSSESSEVISTIFNYKPSQLWLCMPYGKVESDFQKHFYHVTMMRYDDGLGTYVLPVTLLERLKRPSLLKKQFGLITSRLSRFIKDAMTLKQFTVPVMIPKRRYGLFASFVNHPSEPSNLVKVEWHHLKTQLEKFKLKNSDTVKPLQGKTCLILGQYFSLLGFLNRDEELNHYVKLCQYLYKEGYTILWKEHPKNRKPFFNDLKETFAQIEDFNDYHSSYWPLEILVKDLSIDLFVTTTSTSIVVLDKVFGYKIKSSASMMINKLQGADRRVAEILLKKLNKEQLFN